MTESFQPGDYEPAGVGNARTRNEILSYSQIATAKGRDAMSPRAPARSKSTSKLLPKSIAVG